MKKRCFPELIVALLLLLAVPGPPARAESQHDRERITTEGEGEAEIQGRDLSLARGEALEDALQKAFESALDEILPLNLSLTGRQDVLDQLAGRLKRTLLQYRVLSEMPALQVFFVNVEATFSVPLIREDLVRAGITWDDEGAGEPVELFVRIEGVSSVRWYQQVLQLFRQMPNMNTVTLHEVFGTAMVLRLEYGRNLDDLLNAILALHSDEFSFKVEQENEREVSVSLVPMNEPLVDR